MRKLPFTFLLCLALIPAFGQLQKGRYMAGGAVSYYREKQETGYGSYSKSSSVKFEPGVGYFLIDRFAGGLNLNWSIERSEHSGAEYRRRTRQTSISPFVKFYFLPTDKKLNLFARAAYLKGMTKTVNKRIAPQGPMSVPLAEESKASLNGYTLSAGPAYFVNPFTAIELMVSYDVKYYDYLGSGRKLIAGVGIQTFF